MTSSVNAINFNVGATSLPSFCNHVKKHDLVLKTCEKNAAEKE